MSDPGTLFADKKQEEIEKRIHSIYREATADIVKRLNEHSRKLYANDARKRQQVKTGELSKDDYKEWLRRQMFIEKIWNDQIDSATEVLLHANQTAVSIVNGERKAVFAENANYTAYAMEKEARMDLSFKLYDDATVTRLLRDEPQLLPPKKVDKGKDIAWNREKISAVIARGIISGSDIPTIARNIGTETGSSNEKAMTRYARTAMTGAQNAGRIQMLNDAQDMGIKVRKVWLATMDERTRPAHQDLDGQTEEVNEPFSSMLGPIMYPGDPSADEANTWNCFVGDTRISADSTIVHSYKHDYSGKLCTIKTARGIEFTCTPNHPILTPSGWVGANFLHEGSDIVITSIGESDFLRVNPNINHVFPSMEAFHDSFKKSPAERTTSSHVNFHGDRPTSDVEIISKERFLRKHRNPVSGQRSYKLPFKFSAPFVFTKGHLMPRFRGINISSLGFMGGTCKPLSFFWRRLCHAVIHGFRAVSRCNSAVLQTEDYSVSGNSKFLRKCLDRFPGRILLDNVISINVSSVSHVPVYNLQTDNEYYFVNPILECKDGRSNYISVISHNCRCTLTYDYKEYPKQNSTRYDQEDGETIEDMTYNEWLEKKHPERVRVKPEEEVPKPKYASFVPAASLPEAEKFAVTEFTDAGRFGALGVSYEGIGLDSANEINHTIYDFYNTYAVDKFGGIAAPRGNTREGKLISDAVAAYSPIRHSFLLNRKWLKTIEFAEKKFSEEQALVTKYLAHPESFVVKNSLARKVLDASKTSGRSTVPTTVRETIWHELGHSLEKPLKGVANYDAIKAGHQAWGEKVSGYSTTDFGEYIAESFCAWNKGEKIDPELIKGFEALRRQ